MCMAQDNVDLPMQRGPRVSFLARPTVLMDDGRSTLRVGQSSVGRSLACPAFLCMPCNLRESP